MNTVCPYCGHQFDSDSAQSGLTPATCICPGCQHELDRPGEAVPAPPPPPPPPPGGDAGPEGAAPGAAPAWEQARAGDQPGAAPGPGPVWEQGEGGFFQRLWQTLIQVLMHPVVTLGAPARPGLAYPLGFGLIMGTVGSVMMAFWNQVLHSGASSGMFGGGAMMLIMSPLLVLIQIFIVAAVVHFFLWTLRGTSQGYSATFRVVGYSSAANVFLCLPYLGTTVSAVWGLVILVGGLAVVHGTGRGRVVVSLLIPVLLVLILAVITALLVA